MAKYVVLKVVDEKPGFLAHYSPQVAMVQDYDSVQDAATFNVGNHPDAQKNGPYQVVVIPWEHWQVFDVHSNKIRGRDEFEAVPTENPPIVPVST